MRKALTPAKSGRLAATTSSPMSSDYLQSGYLIRTPIVGNMGPGEHASRSVTRKEIMKNDRFFSTSANVHRLVAAIGEYDISRLYLC